MAKRKRRRKRKQTFEMSPTLYGTLFVIISIIGIGKLGPIGRAFAGFSLFLTGSIYVVFLFVLFILGVYIFIKNDWPEFFSTKMLGVYLFVIGLLTLMHWEFVSLNNGSMSIVFKERKLNSSN